MQVGDPFSLYTELYGWFYYSLMWEAIQASGLHLLPPVLLLLKVIAEARESGSMSFTNPDAVIAAIEVRGVLMALAFALFVVPTTTVDVNTFSYNEDASVFNAEARVSVVNDTATTLDHVIVNPAGGTTSVSIPALWYQVSRINHGLTYVIMNNVDVRGKGYRGLKRAMDIAQLENPSIQALLNRFNNECYIPALVVYDDKILDESVFEPPFISFTPNYYITADVSSMSDPLWFTDDYYPSLRTVSQVQGFAYSDTIDVMVTSGGSLWGRPTCEQFYETIADRIRNEPTYVESLNLFQQGLAALGVAVGTFSPDQMLIDRYIQSGVKKSYQSPSDKAVSRRATGKNTYIDATLDMLGIASFAKQALEMEVFVDGAIYAMHHVRSAVMIPLLIGLAVGLIVSMYSWSYALQASIVLFAVTFLPALWAVASWAESVMVTSLFPTPVELVGLFDIDKPRESIENFKKRMAISYASLFMYTVLPIGFVLMLNAAGASLSNAFSSLGTGMSGNLSRPSRGNGGNGGNGDNSGQGRQNTPSRGSGSRRLSIRD